ncbi:hypothetical protein GETHPA_16840 [Geothrix rubra]|uniref:Lipoprotein n=1 Tax=Geothrix rubra TaxID=2927977 RepID=A0ABQ5Q757_9BACT|nr:hypothetical protein [Geothrix rubra]GLH70151.1 hypothetical protein GETHPA_16840 [Geothrix rubra]
MTSKALILLTPLLLACGRPAADVLRQQPAPVLSLELSLPEGPGQAELKRAYLAAFRERFGRGLDTEATAPAPERIQLIVMIGSRSPHSESDARRDRTADQLTSVAAGSPFGLIHSAVGPKSNYEQQVDRLGYRPGSITGQALVLRTGKPSFQEYLRLDPLPIIRRMHPLGEEARNHGGIEAEEADAVAREILALLKEKFGWVPPNA